MKEPPESFVRFDECTRRMLRPNREPQVSTIRVLPSALREVARQAEQTDEFIGFVDDLADQFAIAGEEDCYQVVADVLRRTGYYHSVLAGQDRPDYWPTIADRLFQKERPIRALRMLDGCHFPRDRFTVGGHSVVKMSRSDLGNV